MKEPDTRYWDSGTVRLGPALWSLLLPPSSRYMLHGSMCEGFIEEPDGLWVEAVCQPHGPGLQTPAVSA